MTVKVSVHGGYGTICRITICRKLTQGIIIFGKLSFTFGKLGFGKLFFGKFSLTRAYTVYDPY